MGQKYSTELQSNLANEFYQFCCNGNVNRVREYLPLLSYNEINYINPNTGQTSLHAACLNNHLEIVRLLLENNVCNRIIRNQQNRIAYDVSPSNEIRSLFRRSQQPNETNRFIEICPNRSSFGLITNTRSETNRPDDWVTGYFSSADAQDAQLMMALSHASPIMKLLLYARTESESKIIVQRLIETSIPITHNQYQRAHILYKEFLNKNSVKSLLTLYSLQTPLFGTLQSNADAYTVLLYLHLDELSDLAYRGRLTYRGMIMSFDDLRAYRWAHEHAAIIETRTFQSTSKDRAVAFAFSDLPPGYNNQLSVIIRYKFTQICPTAIDIHNESQFTPEDEVLLLPFTLFRVTSIKERSSDEVLRYEITMQNIPVTPNSLWASSR
ncbi:unnamed protein product [Adineta steineri]|uniref:NAD(P)(+)--arginine ADP-ribosyltransferase n=1 Tax=Adineta steineri TaxID=433720 RepID=A0A819N7L9_9BILA|nr:unnamed protein product [Adineta steineri]